MTFNNKSLIFKIVKVLFTLAIVLFVIAFLAALIFGFEIGQSLRVIFGTVYVLFVPGFIWSYVFFNERTDIHKDVNGVPTETEDKNENPLDLIERITLSIALSMALCPLLIFFLNKIGVKINFTNSFLEILILIIAGFVIIFIQESRNKKNINN